IYLVSPTVTDADLASLASREEVVGLRLECPQVGDKGMAHVRTLTNLRWLALYSKITSAGLKEVEDLDKLQELRAYQLQFGVAGAQSIGKLTGLLYLQLRGTDLDDRGLASFAQLKKLRQLDISGTRVTDEGVRELRHLTALDHLLLT